MRASFRPKGELATLRAYLRQRERLLDYAASHIQHMQKALMQTNVQLHHIVSDITGATGMRIIRGIVAGERDPAALAAHRDRRCHASAEEISAALAGNWREEHIFALGQALDLYDLYQAKVAESDARIEQVLARLRTASDRPACRLPPARHREQFGQCSRLCCTGDFVFCAWCRPHADSRTPALAGAQTGWRMRHRSVALAGCQALHLLALPGTKATRYPVGGSCRPVRDAREVGLRHCCDWPR